MLDNRLSAVAQFVRKGSFAADIGTDHAFLPIYLITQGISSEVIATDINEGPLKAAQHNILSSGLENRIILRRCDGLNSVTSRVDDIIIAGMGGELILSIVDSTSWLKNPDKRLILQPMTQEHKLRQGLCEMGYKIEREHCATQQGKVYCIMCVSYSGTPRKIDTLYSYVGEMPSGTGNVREYLTKQASTLARVAVMLGQSKAHEDIVRARDHYLIAQNILSIIGDLK